MCSKRWAKPLRRGVWLAAPTWYHKSTETSGSRWSSLKMTVRPFASWYFSNLTSGSAARAADASTRTTIAALGTGTSLARRRRAGLGLQASQASGRHLRSLLRRSGRSKEGKSKDQISQRLKCYRLRGGGRARRGRRRAPGG